MGRSASPLTVAAAMLGRAPSRCVVADTRGIEAVSLLTMTAERSFPYFGFERVTRGSR